MKKYYYIFLFFASIFIHAQHYNLVEYKLIDEIGRMANLKDQNEYLIFNDDDLFYVNLANDDNLNFEDEKLDKLGLQYNPIYMDLKNDSIYESRIGMKDNKTAYYSKFVLAEKKSNLNWKITKETQKVLGYITYKATTTFRGREYTAWFAPEIPYNYGPWKLHGLPGLILKVENDKFYYEAKRIVLNSNKITPITSLISLSKAKKKYTLEEIFVFEKYWFEFIRSNTLANFPVGSKLVEAPLRKDARELTLDD